MKLRKTIRTFTAAAALLGLATFGTSASALSMVGDTVDGDLNLSGGAAEGFGVSGNTVLITPVFDFISSVFAATTGTYDIKVLLGDFGTDAALLINLTTTGGSENISVPDFVINLSDLDFTGAEAGYEITGLTNLTAAGFGLIDLADTATSGAHTIDFSFAGGSLFSNTGYGALYTIQGAPAVSAPEPASLLLMGLGLLGFAATRRKA